MSLASVVAAISRMFCHEINSISAEAVTSINSYILMMHCRVLTCCGGEGSRVQGMGERDLFEEWNGNGIFEAK